MKQFFGWVVLITLIAGSICGLVFGIMFGVKNKQFEDSNNLAIIEEYKEKLSNFELQVNDLNSKLTVQIAENEEHEKTIEGLNVSIQQKDTEIESLKTDKTSLETSVSQKQSKIEELNTKITGLETDKENKLTEIETLKTQKESLETEKATLQASLTVKQNKIEELNTRITSLETDKESYLTEIELLKTQKKQLEIEKANLENTVTENQSTIEELNSKITGLETDKENNLTEIETLKTQKAQFETEKTMLQTQLTEKETQITTLESEKSSLTVELEKAKTDLSNNQSNLNELNKQITELQSEIVRLTSLLEAYEQYSNSSLTVTYYVDNKLFDTQVVTMGEKTSQSITPENTKKYDFVKWQINNEDFDFATYTFSKNTRIDAVLNYHIYNVNFIYNETDYHTCQVYGGEFITDFVSPEIINVAYEYKGVTLSLENIDYIDLSTYEIERDTTFYVIVESKYTSIQNFNANDLKTEYSVSNYTELVKLSTLCNNGNTFAGVTIHLIDDIDMSKTSTVKWVPIGVISSKPFSGNFDGHDFTIKNFSYRNNRDENNYFGLFGVFKGTSSEHVKIENVKFENVNIDMFCSKSLGIIVGYSYCADFKNVEILSGILKQSGGFTVSTFVGSFAGSSTNSCRFEDCVNYAEIYAKVSSNSSLKSSAGAFVAGIGNIYINCSNYGKISGQIIYVFESNIVDSVNCYNFAELVYL